MPKKTSLIIFGIEIVLIGLIIGLLFVSYKVTAQELTEDFTIEDTQITEKYTEIATFQEDFIKLEGRYARITDIDKDFTLGEPSGIKIIIHEYITPKGEKGYQVFSYAKGYVKSQGYGAEYIDRTYDWTLIATSTE